MIDFEDIGYLKNGTERQQLAHHVLTKHAIFEKLIAFQPILTGTIPINIDIPSSDLDISCYWTNKEDFIAQVQKSFAAEEEYQLRETIINGEETIIANFKIDGFEIELFGQRIPSKQQNAFRHLLIEQQILAEKGEEFRLEIINLKLQGYKTEPAFAHLLKLEGDPYLSLLTLSK
ncbi:DUF4269 domain-containing protein [Pedobacter sp. Hv1]|uniref:DUF4269 domain-containing protein n=1 Tax=Pedobacter sp. Hv1 TaxID=1740090 RepID=UPI0006D8CA3D|nr:DUF4269 domain-containing protein [Pedobacter sp. Hv1]KQC00453.1 diadenosine tetraphosphate hydrolase [Pedobacter sp. Hv1]